MGLKFLEKDERVSYLAETLEFYRKAGYGLVQGLYKKGERPALLVVDLQESFTSPDSSHGTKGVTEEVIRIVDGVVENTETLLNAVRKKGFPVIYITNVYGEDSPDGGRQGEKTPSLRELCKAGSKWVQVDKRIKPQKHDYLVKKRVASGFIGTPLIKILIFHRVDTCIVVGLSLSGCVRHTVADAVSYDFYAVVPEECVGDRSIGAGKASLFDIMTKFADVASLDDVLSWVNSLT